MINKEIEPNAEKIAEGTPKNAYIDKLLNDDSWHSGWNSWRRRNPKLIPQLSGFNAQNRSFQDIELQDTTLHDANFWHSDLYCADFSRADCHGAKFRNARVMRVQFAGTNLTFADFNHADASNANFRGANLYGASLYATNLTESDFRGANLKDAWMPGAILTKANLHGLDLRSAELQNCVLVETDLSGADISGANVYGISAWDVNTEGTIQRDLVITPNGEPTIAVDNLDLAQFTYLLLKNEKIRSVIDTITSKVVLILGRFTPERKSILDAIREELRKLNYVPLLFDFAKPSSRGLTETVSILAHMSRFVIADITDARSIAHELIAIVPKLPSVPIQPLLLSSQNEYGMFEDLRSYPWVLKPFMYDHLNHLLAALTSQVIAPAEARLEAQISR